MEITGELLLEFKVNTRHDMWESVDEWPKPSEAESQEPAYSVSDLSATVSSYDYFCMYI